ncbi:hypothetical protein QYH69_35720, partial [Paraburkholderia sp. SARCC-3016]|uniref:hypothetical protein n=1 Tax=Paraburkholderia sp. SARCC-3016 TaxID=3058611 RepID=UPI00280952ED
QKTDCTERWLSFTSREVAHYYFAPNTPGRRRGAQVLSPYRREHINRLGDYLLDLQRPVPPLDPTIDFTLKSAF